MLTPEELLAFDNACQLSQIHWNDMDDRLITPAEVAHIYDLDDSYWLHSGNPNHHHATLASGRCSNGFANGKKTLTRGNICRLFAYQMALRLRQVYRGPVNIVLSASYSGNDIGAHLAEILSARHLFTEKREKEQIWNGFEIEPWETVLPIEELITTGGTGEKMISAVVGEGVMNQIKWAPLFLALIRRRRATEWITGIPILPVVDFTDMWDLPPGECPLCAAGSIPIKPKSPIENWRLLIQEMKEGRAAK